MGIEILLVIMPTFDREEMEFSVLSVFNVQSDYVFGNILLYSL